MNHKSKAAFLITACLLIAVQSDQTLDCRKMVYSRHCRGVAIKRGDLRNVQKQPEAFDDSISLKRLLHGLSAVGETFPSDEDVSRWKKPENRLENELHMDNADLNRLLYKLFLSFKRWNGGEVENENFPLFEY